MSQESTSQQTAQKNVAPAQEPWTIRRILEWTTAHLEKNGSDSPRLDAEILLAHARGCHRIHLYTDFDELLDDEVRGRMRDLVKRRAQAEPVAYLVGYREFYSLTFEVNQHVLIPRPDTETLVMEALERAREISAPRILDVGTGSGCIAVTIAKNASTAELTAVDLSPEALEVARRNAVTHHVDSRITFLQSDLFAALPESDRGAFDLIVSNPPYVTEGEMETLQPDIRLHEPHLALQAGTDGLVILRRLIAEAPGFLKPGGTLLTEIADEQADAVRELFRDAGFTQIDTHHDAGGMQRVISGTVSSD